MTPKTIDTHCPRCGAEDSPKHTDRHGCQCSYRENAPGYEFVTGKYLVRYSPWRKGTLIMSLGQEPKVCEFLDCHIPATATDDDIANLLLLA